MAAGAPGTTDLAIPPPGLRYLWAQDVTTACIDYPCRSFPLSPPPNRTTALNKYTWETSLFAVMVAVIMTLTLVTHLPGSARPSDHPTADATAVPKRDSWQPSPPHAPALSTAGTDRPARRPSRPSDPHEIVLGPNSIGGRFILLASNRRKTTATSDELTLRLRVVSLAIADLVTPFQSGMLQVRVPGEQPISPQQTFSHPVPAGNTREEDIVFAIPSNLTLDYGTLRIQYFNEMKEIPLNLSPGANPR
jgi:hypothetical protein